jgi:hypothetical protein
MFIDRIRTSFLEIGPIKFSDIAHLSPLPYGLLPGSTYNEVSIIIFDAQLRNIK